MLIFSKKIKLYSLFLVLILFYLNYSAFPANQAQFDVIYYELKISIDPQTEQIIGSVTTQAISLINGLSQLTFDLFANMTVTSVTGNVVGFSHTNNLLLINLDKVYDQNEIITVTSNYQGHPSSGTNFIPMTFDRSRGIVTISSESCPYYARCWWPCKDRPDDKPDSMDLKITVPSNLVVASNGVLINIKDNNNGTKTHHWQIRNPIATYLVSISGSNYKVIEDKYININNDTLLITHFVYPEHYNLARVDFNNVNQMIQILESYYGKYPYYNEKYGVVEYIGYWGGMEYQTLTSVQPYSITGTHVYDPLFVHELAHQWWGDCVTPKDFHHSWISEGFATFTEALYFGHLESQERYHRYMNNENNALDLKGTLYRHDISDPDIVYASIVYNKGAWVLHMLRHVIGEQHFWAGLLEYRSRFEYGSATTEDLQSAFEKVIGDSLNWFFHQWVYEPNYPHYEYGWHQEKNAGGQYKLYSFIKQIQADAPLFKMPVDLSITTVKSETTFVMMVDDSLEKFKYVSPDSITNFQLDKNNWVLKNTTVITTPLFKYINHQIVDSTENNNGLAEPGETVDIFISITNNGIISRHITARLTSSDPEVLVPAAVYSWADLDAEYDEISNDLVIPLSFSVKSGAIGHLATFKLHLTADNNYATVDSFNVKIGNPDILLVDDDNGANYEFFFHPPMTLAKIYANNWDVSSQGCPSFTDVLQKYQAVIWFTGDDRTTSLTREEQQAIAEYLDCGGWLVLTGQNIGYDLMADGMTEDSLFFKNYLHADFLADTVKSTRMIGVVGDPIGNGLFVYVDPKAGSAGNQQAPSAIAPRDEAQTFLKYIPQLSAAGIRYADDQKRYRLVYLAFGYEGVSGPYQDTSQKLLNRILSWLSGVTTVNQIDGQYIPQQANLEQNYPNPFNSTTKIKYCLPKADRIKLSIYNLSGQNIRTLINRKQEAGIYEIEWDGRNSSNLPVASGIYIYRLITETVVCSRKLALIK